MFNVIHGSSIITSHYLAMLKSSFTAVRFVYQFAPSNHYVDKLIRTQRNNLQNSIAARKYPLKLDTVINDWYNLLNARRTLEELETRKVTLSQSFKEQLSSKESSPGEDATKLKEEAKQVRNEIKNVSKDLKMLEEKAISGILALPNLLHSRTPLDCNQESPAELEFFSQGGDLTALERYHDFVYRSVHSPTSVYLKDRVADAEASCIESWARDWSTKGFLRVTCPDMVKRVVLLGCGPESEKLYLMRDDHEGDGDGMALVGGGSLHALLALLTRMVVEDPFPLRLYSVGRRYVPPADSSKQTASSQDTSVQLLAVTKNCPDEMFNELVSMQATVTQQLTELKVPFQLKPLYAHELLPWEQYSSVIKVPLPEIGEHVTLARFSIAGDYISRRLSIYAGPQRIPPGMVTANVVPFVKHFMFL